MNTIIEKERKRIFPFHLRLCVVKKITRNIYLLIVPSFFQAVCRITIGRYPRNIFREWHRCRREDRGSTRILRGDPRGRRPIRCTQDRRTSEKRESTLKSRNRDKGCSSERVVLLSHLFLSLSLFRTRFFKFPHRKTQSMLDSFNCAVHVSVHR